MKEVSSRINSSRRGGSGSISVPKSVTKQPEHRTPTGVSISLVERLRRIQDRLDYEQEMRIDERLGIKRPERLLDAVEIRIALLNRRHPPGSGWKTD
jgi:hypothetical protein